MGYFGAFGHISTSGDWDDIKALPTLPVAQQTLGDCIKSTDNFPDNRSLIYHSGMAINNTLSNGLVSTSPLSGGYSTAPGQGVVGGSLVSLPTARPPTQGLVPAPKTAAPVPQQTAPAQTSGINSYGLTSSSPNWYQLQNGESVDNYNSRVNTAGNIAAAVGGQQTPAPAPSINAQGNQNAATGSTFGNAVGNLAQTSSAPSTAFTQSQGTAQTAATNLLNSAPQQNSAVLAQQQSIQNLQNQYANLRADNATTPGDLSLANGEQGALYNRYSEQLGAQQTGLQNILAGNAQQQAAYTGAGNLANTTQGAATSQQGTQQSGLASTAAALSPQLGQYGQTQYSPLGGTVGGDGGSGGSLNPINNIQSLAQQVINHQISPQQAYAMGGSVPNFQGALNAAIQQVSPGFNTATAQGQYDANQANTQTSGVTPTNAAAASYAQSYQQLLDLQNTTSNVDQFGTLLLNSMVAPDGSKINPSDIKYANEALSTVRNQLSSQQQAQFDSTYAALKSKVSGLLATGGSEIPTQITSDANKILDGSLPLSSLSAVLQRITTEGTILTQNLQNKVNTAGGVIGAPKSGSNNNPAGI